MSVLGINYTWGTYCVCAQGAAGSKITVNDLIVGLFVLNTMDVDHRTNSRLRHEVLSRACAVGRSWGNAQTVARAVTDRLTAITDHLDDPPFAPWVRRVPNGWSISAIVLEAVVAAPLQINGTPAFRWTDIILYLQAPKERDHLPALPDRKHGKSLSSP